MRSRVVRKGFRAKARLSQPDGGTEMNLKREAGLPAARLGVSEQERALARVEACS